MTEKDFSRYLDAHADVLGKALEIIVDDMEKGKPRSGAQQAYYATVKKLGNAANNDERIALLQQHVADAKAVIAEAEEGESP